MLAEFAFFNGNWPERRALEGIAGFMGSRWERKARFSIMTGLLCDEARLRGKKIFV